MAEAMAKDELGKRRLDDAASRMASKSARVEEADDEADRRQRLKRASDVDVRELDEERNQRDDEAQSSNKRQPEQPAEAIDGERDQKGARLGILKVEAGARAPADARSFLSCNLLSLMYSDDGQELSLIHI